MKRGFILGLWLVGWAAAPCEQCKLEPNCLGECAYKELLRAESRKAEAQAYMLLAYAWMKGGLEEGVPRLLYEVMNRTALQDTLRYYAMLLLAQTYYQLGRQDSTLLLYERVIAEAQGYPFFQACAHLKLAALYKSREPLKAAAFSAQAAEWSEKTAHPLLQALAYNQLAVTSVEVYMNLNQALTHAQKAHKLAEQSLTTEPHVLLEPPIRVYLATIANLASLYAEQKKFEESQRLYELAIQQATKARDSITLGQALVGLAGIFLSKGDFSSANRLLSLPLYANLPYELKKEALQIQIQIALSRKDFSQAFRLQQKLLEEAEAQIRQAQGTRLEQIRVLSGLEAREAELHSLQQRRRQENLLYFMGAGLGGLLLVAVGYIAHSARRRAAEERNFREIIAAQAEKIEQQAEVLLRQNEELVRVSHALSEALANLHESHGAARRLQRAMLPPLEKLFPEAKLWYQPMQEISGDFYEIVWDAKSQRLLIAFGDCTGHGVPGAILTGIFITKIRSLFLQSPQDEAQKILQRLSDFFRTLLKHEQEVSAPVPLQEGSELALVVLDFQNERIEYALAARPVWIYHPVQGWLELDGAPIGIESSTPPDYVFPTHQMPLDPQLVLYLFSDGLTDVLSPTGKRWGIRKLRRLLQSPEISALPYDKQMERVQQEIFNWRQNTPVNDDLTFCILPISSVIAGVRHILSKT